MYDMINIFEVFLPQLLRYPNPSDPLNGEAAALMMREPKGYEAKVKGTKTIPSTSNIPSLTPPVCVQNTSPSTPVKKLWTRRARTPNPKTSSALLAAMNLAVKSPLAQWTMSNRPTRLLWLPAIWLGPASDLHEHIASSTLLYLIFSTLIGTGPAGVAFIAEFIYYYLLLSLAVHFSIYCGRRWSQGQDKPKHDFSRPSGELLIFISFLFTSRRSLNKFTFKYEDILVINSKMHLQWHNITPNDLIWVRCIIEAPLNLFD